MLFYVFMRGGGDKYTPGRRHQVVTVAPFAFQFPGHRSELGPVPAVLLRQRDRGADAAGGDVRLARDPAEHRACHRLPEHIVRPVPARVQSPAPDPLPRHEHGRAERLVSGERLG